jgi:hypothetical protein
MSARGEGVINVGDSEVQVLFTNRALAAAERAMGRSSLSVGRGFLEGTAGVTELACLLQAGMEAARRDGRTGGSPVSLDDAYDLLDQVGFSNASIVVMQAMAAVISYSNGRSEADSGKKKRA